MNKYIPIGLRTIALGGSIASTLAAFPAAAKLFGAAPGGFLLTATATIIYAGWHYAATTDNTDRRLIAGGIATVFAIAMTYGIATSADIKTGDNASLAAGKADTLYKQQEQARMATLTSVTAELRATSKTKFPTEYASLQKQVEQLSTPTQRTSSASQIVQGMSHASSLYQWGIAATFEIVTLALLLLAGFFTSRQPASTLPTPASTLTTTPPTQEKQALEPIAISEPETPSTTLTTTVNNPANLLATRQIQPNSDGFITASAIAEATGCTDRQARDAIKTAHQQGWLIKTGEGGATRYSYPTQQRPLWRVK